MNYKIVSAILTGIMMSGSAIITAEPMIQTDILKPLPHGVQEPIKNKSQPEQQKRVMKPLVQAQVRPLHAEHSARTTEDWCAERDASTIEGRVTLTYNYPGPSDGPQLRGVIVVNSYGRENRTNVTIYPGANKVAKSDSLPFGWRDVCPPNRVSVRLLARNPADKAKFMPVTVYASQDGTNRTPLSGEAPLPLSPEFTGRPATRNKIPLSSLPEKQQPKQTAPKLPPAQKQLSPGSIAYTGPVESLPEVPTATLETPHSGGVVLTGSFAEGWRCSNNRCSIMRRDLDAWSSFSLRQTVAACARLAQQVGRITLFTNGRQPLDAEMLARCNSPFIQELEINACSGDDDLRGRTSELRMGINTRHGNFTLANYKKLFEEIPANTCKSKRIGGVPWFNPFSLSALQSLHFYVNNYDTRSYMIDNWDMAKLSVIATLTDPGGRRYLERIVDLQGNPIKRFEKSDFWHIDINP